MAGLKAVGFIKDLQEIVLNGSKTITWRLWDDKDLQEGNVFSCVDMVTRAPFAKAKITQVQEKPFKDLKSEDKDGHEKFASDQEMYDTYARYYHKKVDENTIVKIIKFELIKE